jgi:ribokinase
VSTPGPLAVLGAVNVDLVVHAPMLPRPGRTVVGGDFETHQGGKGGNQAVAAARAGAPVAFVGAVGDDPYGEAARASLAAEGIDVTRLRTDPEHPTGVALIAVDRKGANQIVVAPGANQELVSVRDDLEALGPSLVLASCEVDHGALLTAGRWCEDTSVPLVLNPAPANLRLRGILDHASVTTPNAEEVLDLTAAETEAVGAARALRRRNPDLSVVITLGEDGAFVADATGETLIDAPLVEVVDTTGAGDCMSGVLAAGLHAGLSLHDAVRRAVAAASLSVQIAGAREGMPTAAAIDAALGA